MRLVERFQLDHEQLPPLMAAVLRQLQKARVEMEPTGGHPDSSTFDGVEPEPPNEQRSFHQTMVLSGHAWLQEPALQGALAALLNAHGWMRLMAARARPLPVQLGCG